MTVPTEIQEALDKERYEAAEDAWLLRLEEHPDDVAGFIAAGQAMVKAGEEERARPLLEMVDDALVDAARWRERLELLRRCGALYVKPGKLHAEILKTLGELYGGSPSFAEMVEKVGLKKATDDIPKTWKKVDRLVALLEFDVGSIVYLEGQGAGTVAEVNMQLESFKIVFDGEPDLRVGFGGAAKLLKALPEDHVLRRKVEDPDTLRALATAQPSEALRLVLESWGIPRTGAEVRRDLAGIVPEGKWTSWWTAARKHPQVVAAQGNKRAYVWAASSGDAQDAVWKDFEAADPYACLELLRRNASRDPDLKRRMSEALATTAAGVAEEAPGLAWEIWFQLEKHGVLPGEVGWAPAVHVARLTDQELQPALAGIRDRTARERVYELAAERRPDWTQLAAKLLTRETDPRALDTLAAQVSSADPELFQSTFDQILNQPRKSPASFTWLAERAKDEPEWLARNPPRLLKHVLWAFTDEAFTPLRTRLLPLCESGSTLPRLLDHLSEEQASQVDIALRKTPALLDYQREPLLNALHLRFPHLRQEEEAPFYATPESIVRKDEELRRLVEEELPTNRKAIEEARELGDLRENFEYKSARQRHEYLSARASALDRDLRRVRPIDPSTVNGQEVVIGSRLRLEGEDGSERQLTILGPWESSPENNVLSNESELAQVMLGAKLGDEVELEGVSWRVASIEPHA